MKKLLTSSLLLLTSSFLAVSAAQVSLLYFKTDAYDPTGWKYFDYAMIGVVQYDGSDWVQDWGEGGSKMYLRLYDSANASIGGSSAAATESQVMENLSAYTRGADTARFTALGWADVSDYTSGDYKFYLETYSNDDDDPIWGYSDSVAKSYAELIKYGFIYQPGATNPQDVEPWTIPEPASGLLVLLGAGLAAWRKRRQKVCLVRSIGVDKIDRRR